VLLLSFYLYFVVDVFVNSTDGIDLHDYDDDLFCDSLFWCSHVYVDDRDDDFISLYIH